MPGGAGGRPCQADRVGAGTRPAGNAARVNVPRERSVWRRDRTRPLDYHGDTSIRHTGCATPCAVIRLPGANP
ncbi:MAG: hypothetical protein K6T81_12885 [Alicyclobacillus macrosporangiidus]|uniref:hypothetical protein n=1 Tax=Alicyclobacillus macrosporangiidus TaxID=392015 RepID=UPI0026EF4E83|nr:hypothetical protein [Alicyclobacillus macrosporangiidus]MCL6599618.1 hypothetical protein [Alicyclobacillus macrosporangiidus]